VRPSSRSSSTRTVEDVLITMLDLPTLVTNSHQAGSLAA
jgi:hypothetical protein